MIELLLGALYFPSCAIVAGAAAWALNRGEEAGHGCHGRILSRKPCPVRVTDCLELPQFQQG